MSWFDGMKPVVFHNMEQLKSFAFETRMPAYLVTRFPLDEIYRNTMRDWVRGCGASRVPQERIYECVAGQVHCEDGLFEDWWVHVVKGSVMKRIIYKSDDLPEGEVLANAKIDTSISLNDIFDKIFIINLDRRQDRWIQCQELMEAYKFKAERFAACDMENGHAGCTASHKKILELIHFNQWPRTLVLEDDFEPLHRDMNTRVKSMMDLAPSQWDIIYLGGQYRERPQSRYSERFVKVNGILMTSSYVITPKFAAKMAPSLLGNAQIDCLFSGFLPEANAYICEPRLFVQRPSYSDLSVSFADNRGAMLDLRHADGI
jgi:hypothetical protein